MSQERTPFALLLTHFESTHGDFKLSGDANDAVPFSRRILRDRPIEIASTFCSSASDLGRDHVWTI